MIALPSFPCFSADARSLAKSCLTKEIYEQLINLETGYGFTLHDALRSGIQNPDSSIGIYAGDPESYDLFSAIFNPVIEKYHAIKIASRPIRSDFTPADFPDPDPSREYIISTRIRVARNLNGFPFTPIISSTDRKKVEEILMRLLEQIEPPFKGHYTPAKEYPGIFDQKKGNMHIPQDKVLQNRMSFPQEKRHILLKSCFKKGDRFQDSAGINRDWPESRGVFQSNDHRFSAWINEEDHIRIISMDQGGNISEVFNRLAKALDIIERELDRQQTGFAWKDHLGYLAACPSNLGTAMRAGVHIRLPELFRRKDVLDSEAKRLRLQTRGTQGEKTEVESAVFDISNSQRLGVTERECCETLCNGICEIIELERKLQGA
ncbi:MAG: arginine kinase [Desulfamplus sp.]|nr:arginine kinase [Desulfamplus sp.]